MVYISCMATIAKNIPKLFLKKITFICVEILAPIIAPIIPNIEIIIANSKFIFLFFILTIIATNDVGIKKIKFAACAICCSTPKTYNNKKIKTVPPPVPVPLTIPDISPISISAIVIFSLFLLVLTIYFSKLSTF